MGSWNATCNISQLPILPGDPVRVLFLSRCPYSMDPPNDLALGEGNNSRENCYPTDFWFPRTIPLKAEYADYGDVDKLENGLPLQLFWDQLKADMLPVPEGKNQYHDPGTKEDMTWEHMWWVATEGRLRVNGNHERKDYTDRTDFLDKGTPTAPKALPVCVVLIREDVFQAILGLTSPWDQPDRFSHVDPDEPKEMQKALPYEAKLPEAIRVTYRRLRVLMDLTRKETPSERVFSRFMVRHELSNTSPPFTLGVGYYLERLIELVDAKKIKGSSKNIDKVLVSMAEILHVMKWYHATRRTWHPGTGCGSQGTEFEGTAQFHEAISMIGYKLFEKDELERGKWDEDHKPRKAVKLAELEKVKSKAP